MTDTPVFVVRPTDPKDMTQVRHVGPGTPRELRGQADAPHSLPQTPPPAPGPVVLVVRPMQPGDVRVVGRVPEGRP